MLHPRGCGRRYREAPLSEGHRFRSLRYLDISTVSGINSKVSLQQLKEDIVDLKYLLSTCYAGYEEAVSRGLDLENMSKTIYGIPMVAEYDETNNCFKGHGGKVEISDKGIEFVQTTVPYGFVDPVTPVFYEEVTELDGMTKHNYLCCYAYLWYKRYPEVENVLRNQDNSKIGQSMEIHVNSYEFDEEDYCVIKDGHFSALCMLGVEPCFESASVTSKFSKEESDVWEEMINSFKKYAVEEEDEEDDEEEEEDYEKEDEDEEIVKLDNLWKFM